MDEQAVRVLVREAVARHLGAPHGPQGTGVRLQLLTDASHYRYQLPETDGPCLIEPTVQCSHCGYCQSHGH